MVDIGTIDKCVIDCRLKNNRAVISPCKLNGNIWVEKDGRKYICEKDAGEVVIKNCFWVKTHEE